MAFINTMGLEAETVGMQVPQQNLINHERRDPMPTWSMETFFKQLMDWAAHENKAEESLRHRKWYRNERFYQGQHLIKFDARTGTVLEGNPRPEDPFYPNNQIRAHIKSLHKEVVRSNAEILIKAKSDDPQKTGGARAAKARYQDIQRTHWGADKKQEETQNLLLKGNSFRYDIWDKEGGEDTEEPTYGDEPIDYPGEAFCTDCGASGDPEMMMGGCPCGSTNVMQSEPFSTTIPVQNGVRKLKTGDISKRVIPPERIKLHLHARRFEDSPYLLMTDLMLKEVVDYVYPQTNITAGTAANDSGLRMEMELERSPGYVSSGHGSYYNLASSGDQMSRWVKVERYWFQPIMYAAIQNVLSQDEPIGWMGDIIPAGTQILELFPDGLHITRIGDAIVDVRNESFLDHFVMIVWDKLPGRIWGDAYIDDLIEPQRQLNELDSLRFENFMFNSVLSKVYNPLKIERGRMGVKPGRWVPMKNPTLMDEPGKYIYQPEDHYIQGADLYAEEKRRALQFLAGSFNPETGIPGSGGNTATGMSILRDLVVSLISVPLELRAWADVKTAYIDLKLIQTNDRGSRYLTLLSPYGEPEGQWFNAADIDADYEITVKPHSWIPRSELERKQDITEASVAGGIQGGVWSPMFPREAKPFFIEALNLPAGTDPTMADRRKCRLNIDKIVKGVVVAQQNGLDPMAFTIGTPGIDPMTGQPIQMGMPVPDPMTGQVQMIPPQVTVDPEDDGLTHVETIKEYLKTDMGMALDPMTKQIIRMYFQQAKMKAQMDMMEAAMQQMMMGPPPGGPGGEQGGGPGGPKGPPKQGGDGGGPKGKGGPPQGGTEPKQKETF